LRLGEKIDPGGSLTGAQRGGGIVEEPEVRALEIGCRFARSIYGLLHATDRACVRRVGQIARNELEEGPGLRCSVRGGSSAHLDPVAEELLGLLGRQRR